MTTFIKEDTKRVRDRLLRTFVSALVSVIVGWVSTYLVSKALLVGENGGSDGSQRHHAAAVRSLVVHPSADTEEGGGLDDVGGLDGVKEELRRCVLLPLRHSSLFFDEKTPKALRPPTGVLLVGPPGTGKTMLARAVAREAGVPLLSLHAAALESKWWGETPKVLEAAFRVARTELAPCIVFFDEVDGLGRARSEGDQSCVYSLKCELLRNMDSVTDVPVTVLGCTNCPDSLDPALRRRFSKRLRVGLPDRRGRLAILERLLSEEMMVDGTVAPLASATEGFTGADLAALVSDASSARLADVDADQWNVIASRTATGAELVQALGPLRRRHWEAAAAKRGLKLSRRRTPPPAVNAPKVLTTTTREEPRTSRSP